MPRPLSTSLTALMHFVGIPSMIHCRWFPGDRPLRSAERSRLIRMPSPRRESKSSRQYCVDVIELDDRACPGGRRWVANRPCVYVGSTGKTPDMRYADHRAGGRSANRFVTRSHVRLRPDLDEGYGPFGSSEQAEAAEVSLGAELRADGHMVRGATGGNHFQTSGRSGYRRKRRLHARSPG